MHFTHASIQNFGIIKDLDIEFRPGINGIVGPNGSGKSTVLDALCLSITGVSRGGGRVADNLSWGEKRGRIHVDFKHGDTTYAITRAIGKAGQRLVTPTGEFTKQDEIESILSGVLDASMDALLHNTFVPQGAIDSILFSTNTQRLREIQQTVGLTRAADGERGLTAEISTYTLTIGLKEQIDSTAAALKQANAEEDQYRAELVTVQAALEALIPYQDVLRRAIDAERNNAALIEAQKQVDAAKADLDVAEALVVSVTEQYAMLKRMLADLEPEATNIRMALAEADASERAALLSRDMRAQLTTLDTALAQYTTVLTDEQIAELDAKVITAREATALRKRQISGETARKRLPQEDELLKLQPGFEQAVALTRAAFSQGSPELVELKAEITRLSKDIDVFITGECPTCHQPIPGFDIAAQSDLLHAKETRYAALTIVHSTQMKEAYAKALGDLQELEKKLAGYNEAAKAMLAKLLITATAEYDTAVFTHRTAVDTRKHYQALIERKKFIVDSLAKAGSSEPSLVDTAELKAVLQHFDRQISAASALDTRVQVVTSQASGAQTALRKAEEIKAALGRIEAVDGATLMEAKLKVQELQQVIKVRQDLLSKIGIVGGKIQETTDQLQRLKNQFVSEEKQATWVQLCRRVRDVVHVNGLPTLLMREYAGVLNRRLAHYLAIWEAPFVMRLDDRLAFQVDFSDGRSHGAERLSGGQKIVASTSFRLAMADTFARQVGLLVLDEPSNYLDKDNIIHLQGLLLRLKEHASSTGRQIILVTHEESLMGFFDHSITLYR